MSWNRGAELLFGYPSNEVIGRSITVLIPADRLGEEDRVLESIRQGRRVEPFDTIRRRRDGTLVDVSVSVSPVRDQAGAIIGASKIARDISERKQLERDRRRLQERLLGLVEASARMLGSPDDDAVLATTIAFARDVLAADGCAVWSSDASGRWTITRSVGLSDSFASRVVATSAQRAVNRRLAFSTPQVFEDPAGAPMVADMADMKDAYRAEGIASMVVFPLTVGGEASATMTFYARTRRAFSEIDVQVGQALANIAAAALTTARLYSEQRTAREAADRAWKRAAFLAEAGTALSASLDYEETLAVVAKLAVPTTADWCAVHILDEHGSLHCLAVAHVDPAKVELARKLQERYPPDPNAAGGMYDVIRTGKAAFIPRIAPEVLDARAGDEEHRRIVRELSLTSYMCVPMSARGTTFGAITFVTAESGREYSDADLQLAQEIAARSSLAVENARSYARAYEANRLKDEFLAVVSHELRTPLNAVLGYTRMLQAGTLAAGKVAAALNVLERNAASLKRIIEDLLDVSRIVAGRLRLNVEPVDLPAVLREACTTVVPAADAKGVRLETTLDQFASPVSGDAERLRQVVWNLLSNAIKFTPRGGTVQLRLARVNTDAEITVSDTGCGIAPAFLPFVFDRFRQGDPTSLGEQGGLGLGLAIAKQLVEQHGGSVRVASGGVGHGATFTVSLPVVVVHRSPSPEAEPRELPHAERQSPPL